MEHGLKQEIDEFIKSLDLVSTPLIERYINYIKDKNIQLEERWEMFVDAPNFWKVHKPYMANFRIERKIEMEWFDCFCCEKYETVDMVDIVEQIDEFIDSAAWAWTTELQIELMEEILEQNLGSFVLDW